MEAKIKELLGRSPEISGHLFHEDTYISLQGKSIRQYLMNLLGRSPEISGDLFHESNYTDSKNRSYRQYLMNRKGFFMVVEV